jgi:hypothetical protein
VIGRAMVIMPSWITPTFSKISKHNCREAYPRKSLKTFGIRPLANEVVLENGGEIGLPSNRGRELPMEGLSIKDGIKKPKPGAVL